MLLESVTVDIVLNVAETPPLLDGAENRDGHGIPDAREGTGDSDHDGVPEYLDSIDNPAVPQGLAGVSEHGQSMRIVLPQLVSLANVAVYRKYVPGSGWRDFVTDYVPGHSPGCYYYHPRSTSYGTSENHGQRR